MAESRSEDRASPVLRRRFLAAVSAAAASRAAKVPPWICDQPIVRAGARP
jgi:hypothetical protein